jgi:hypothetical protein
MSTTEETKMGKATQDPRGPERKIVETSFDGNRSPQLFVKLDCGHMPDLNPIYAYRVGDRCRCYACRDSPLARKAVR